jgi:hypothetical protein
LIAQSPNLLRLCTVQYFYLQAGVHELCVSQTRIEIFLVFRTLFGL